MKKQRSTIVFALLFSLMIPIVGYFYTGWLIAFLFLIGYLTGFFLWLINPAKVPFAAIKAPYWVTLLVFIFLHKVEENRMKFFEVVGDKMAGLLGAIYSFTLPETKIGFSIPVEKLFHVNGTARENFTPKVLVSGNENFLPMASRLLTKKPMAANTAKQK